MSALNLKLLSKEHCQNYVPLIKKLDAKLKNANS